MQEEIKDIAEQAGFYIPECDNNHDLMKLELFANLLISKAVQVVNSVKPGYKDYRSQIEEAMQNDCVYELRKHFGLLEE